MLAIIQARSSSKRFKNKVMFEIRNKPLIWYVYNSVRKSKYVKKIIISTSKDNSDNLLVNFLKNNKINYFRGSLVNVAERLYETAKKNKSDFFLRISGDSPLINSKVINRSIEIHRKSKRENYDLITNIFPRSFPSGQSVEIIKTSALKRILNFKLSNSCKEHVTKYFYQKNKQFKIKNFKSSFNFKKTKYSIDTVQDFKNLKQLIKK